MILITKLSLLQLIPLICAVNTVSFFDNAKRNLELSNGVNKISKLRLILIGDLKKQNELQQQYIDNCLSSSLPLKITTKSCPCEKVICNSGNAPVIGEPKRRINLSCQQVCCSKGKSKKPSIRSLSEAQINSISKYSFNLNCETSNSNGTESLHFAHVYEKNNGNIACGVLVHNRFIVTTAISVMNKKAADLVIRLENDDQERYVKNIIIHPNFFKTIDTLQDNIALLMLDKEIYDMDLPCITKSKNINLEKCHVYSFNTKFHDSLKVDDVEIFKKSECYTALLINGKKHEKYVNKGNNNICTGNSDHHELKINLSGSALTCNSLSPNKKPILKGLLTWSTKLNSYPHLFTDVTQFIDWMEQTFHNSI
ncbi:unnamed protein product [Diamesa tonsa]